MTHIVLGNAAPIERVLVNADTGEHQTRTLPAPAETVYGPPPDWSFAEAFNSLVGPNGVWEWHSTEPPTWVAGDDPVLVQAIAAHYGCEIHDLPDGLEGT